MRNFCLQSMEQIVSSTLSPHFFEIKIFNGKPYSKSVVDNICKNLQSILKHIYIEFRSLN